MKSAFGVLLLAAAALGCHGQSGPAQRNQPQYDVVQEGQSGSATSTISAPGETQPPATATNTDTTGTFALGTALPPANMPGGPAAGGVMPQQQSGSMASGMPPATAAPAPVPRASSTVNVPPPPQPLPTMTTTVVTTTTQAPPPRTRPVRRPPPAETTDTTATTTSSDTATTDTATTDTTSTEKPKKDKEKTDTSQPPPTPPPTTTDTIGGR